MKYLKTVRTLPNIMASTRTLCINGMLLHAVQVILQGFEDWEVEYFLDRKHHCGTPEQLKEIVLLAHLAINAAKLLPTLPRGQRLPADKIPRV